VEHAPRVPPAIQTLGVDCIEAMTLEAVRPHRTATVRERIALICWHTTRSLTIAALNAVPNAGRAIRAVTV